MWAASMLTMGYSKNRVPRRDLHTRGEGEAGLSAQLDLMDVVTKTMIPIIAINSTRAASHHMTRMNREGILQATGVRHHMTSCSTFALRFGQDMNKSTEDVVPPVVLTVSMCTV
jgi:hypothetical protein